MNRINRKANKLFAFELLVIAAVGVSLSMIFKYWLYPLMGLPSTAPIPGRTLVVFLVIAGFILRRKESWTDFGLGRPDRVWATILIAIGLFMAKLLIVQPLADLGAQFIELPKADHGVFEHIYGNLPALVGWLAIAWGIGGFAEEFIFRGFLMRRVADILSGGAWGWAIALFVQAIIFGALHYYLGPAGVVSATFSAFFYGLFFITAGRSLWPVIIVHAVWDSLAFTLIYFNGVTST